jgi:DNA polymerase III sliding clamp (beta) subunit (PCNA family)
MTKIDLKTSNAKEFKDFITALGILDEFYFHIGKTGIHINELSNDGISMVEGDLSKNLFSKWDVKEGILNVQRDHMKDALAHIKKNDQLSIKSATGKEEEPLLKFSIGKEEREMPYSDKPSERELKKEPKVDFTAEITVPAKVIKEFLSKAKKIDRYVLLVADKKRLILFCKGNNEKIREEIPVEKGINKLTTASFNIGVLGDMLKGAGKKANIKMDMKTNEPLRLSYGTGYWNVKYWLAPYMMEEREKGLIEEALAQKSENKKREKLRA